MGTDAPDPWNIFMCVGCGLFCLKKEKKETCLINYNVKMNRTQVGFAQLGLLVGRISKAAVCTGRRPALPFDQTSWVCS